MNKEEFVSRIYSSSYIDKIKKKVNLLGIGDKINPYDLIITRLITSVVIFVLII